MSESFQNYPNKKIYGPNTLRLSDKQRFGDWSTWTRKVKENIINGDIESAAWTLACCMVGPDSDESEIEKARAMFTLPELSGRHQELWDWIVKKLELRFDDGVTQKIVPWKEKEATANFLFDQFEWKID